MTAIVSVCDFEGQVFYHTRKGLVPYAEKHKATQFKTIKHAIKLARKKYNLGYNRQLRGWIASTI